MMSAALICHCLKCDTDRWQLMQNKENNDVLGRPECMRMYVCLICGNKRCPHSDDHQNPCTGSNEPGQNGSRYPKRIQI